MTSSQVLTYSFLILFSFCILSTKSQGNSIISDDFFTIFKRADRNADEKLQGSEIYEAIKEGVILTFRLNALYFDEEMVEAIATKLAREYNEEYIKEDFRHLFNGIPSRVHTFRDQIFKELIEIYRIENLLHDTGVTNEIRTNPDLYGLTYAAYKVLTFKFDDAVREAGVHQRHTYSGGSSSYDHYGGSGSYSSRTGGSYSGIGSGGDTGTRSYTHTHTRTADDHRTPDYGSAYATNLDNRGIREGRTVTTTTTTVRQTEEHPTHVHPGDVHGDIHFDGLSTVDELTADVIEESHRIKDKIDHSLHKAADELHHNADRFVEDTHRIKDKIDHSLHKAVDELHNAGRYVEDTIARKLDHDVREPIDDAGYVLTPNRDSHLNAELHERLARRDL